MIDAECEQYLRRLRFPGELERAFQAHHYVGYRRPLRIGMLVMALMNAGFFLAGIAEGYSDANLLLVVGLLASNLTMVAGTYFPGFARWWQPFAIGWALIGSPLLFRAMALGMAELPQLAADPWARLMTYETRALIFLVWPFALIRLQFRWMLALQSILLLVSLGAALAWLQVPATSIWTEYAKQMAPTFILTLLAAYVLERAQRSAFLANHLLDLERCKSEAVLRNTLPASVVDRLKRTESIADDHAEATVLFADIADFTSWAAEQPAREVLQLLNEIFSRFDRLVERFGLEKIKTVGDCYMVVGGAPAPKGDHLEAMARLALAMQSEAAQLSRELSLPLRFRIGIHTGPLIGGVIGEKRLLYDVWGDTVNTASRLESHGVPGAIQVSAAVAEGLSPLFSIRRRGNVDLKGKGSVETFILEGELN